MKVGEKIDFLLKKTAMTKVELAKKLGLKDSSAVSHWVVSRSMPERNNLKKLSQIFDKPVSYFSDDITYSQMDAMKAAREPAIQSIGVIATVSRNLFNISLYAPVEEYLPIFLETKGTAKPFALKVNSEEVYAGAIKGEYVIIVPSDETSDGKLTLVKQGMLYCLREVCYEKNYIILKDGKKQTKVKPQEIEITGVVAGFFRK